SKPRIFVEPENAHLYISSSRDECYTHYVDTYINLHYYFHYSTRSCNFCGLFLGGLEALETVLPYNFVLHRYEPVGNGFNVRSFTLDMGGYTYNASPKNI